VNPREAWTTEFVNALFLNERPDLSPKFARTIAATLWPTHKHLSARDAARQWAAARPAKP